MMSQTNKNEIIIEGVWSYHTYNGILSQICKETITVATIIVIIVIGIILLNIARVAPYKFLSSCRAILADLLLLC